MEDLIALLEECLENGDQGQAVLFAWFLAERDVIISVIKEAAA